MLWETSFQTLAGKRSENLIGTTIFERIVIEGGRIIIGVAKWNHLAAIGKSAFVSRNPNVSLGILRESYIHLIS